ncbi:MAG: ABC transporter ATP-binding protein [Rivularia sp. (in: Bacteria)]|nr:ABC transporter ATP-binding protein [Rivularia sp. MS3]
MLLIRSYNWVVFIIIGLGILASLAEGIGISLMVPLLQSLEAEAFQSTQQQGWISILESPFQGFSVEHRLAIVAVAMTVAILLKNVLVYTNKALFGWFKHQVGHRLRSKIFNQLLNINYNYLEAKDSGELLNLLAGESWQVIRALEMLVNIVISLCTLVVFTVLLLLLSWRLMVLVSFLTLLISVIVQQVTRRAKALGQQTVKANSQLTTLMCEGLTGMQTIRAFNREGYEQQRFDESSNLVKKTFWQLELLYGAVDPLHEGLSTFLVVGVLVISLLRDPTALSAILTFMFMLYRLQPHIKLIDFYRVNLLATEGGVQAVMEFFNSHDKNHPITGYKAFSGLQHKIAFDKVSFGYSKGKSLALENISVDIPHGQTTAIVGPSGGGKSTLIKLICRFYNLTEGEIYVDGVSLDSLNLHDWRERIAIVSQDIHIFSSTIRENIAYGKLEATEAEIIAAAKQAHAHEFILELPFGYDTPVGERGTRLSGGQRQRLALARAIVRNPDILILDEATNALDTLSENLIQQALEIFSQERTVIVIAHRLSTIEQADQILVLKDGQIVEQGNLPQLLENKSLFNQLYQLQYRNALSNS